MDLLLAFLVAMVITMALIPPLIRLAARWHVIDVPGERKVHTHPIPRTGGIAMVLGALLPLALWLPMTRLLISYLVGSVVLLGFGIWDDRADLNPIIKLFGQVLAVLIVMVVGHVAVDSLVLSDRLMLPQWLGFGLTFFFLLGVTNAINLSDGLDGLAGGTTLVGAVALLLLANNWGVAFVATLGAVLAGAIVGFLRFNTHPARVFMGDAGSQFLGYSAGVMSVLLTQGAITPLSTTVPLLLLGLPIIDTLTVMIRRIRAGRSPFSADRKHLHHRLLDLGFDHHEAVIVIYSVQCLLLLFAWKLRYENDSYIIAALIGIATLVIGGLHLLERQHWRWRDSGSAVRPSLPARLSAWLNVQERLWRWSLRVGCTCAGLYLLGVAWYGSPIGRDIGALAALGLAALLPGLLWPRWRFGSTWLVRGALYVGIALAVYLDHITYDYPDFFRLTKWIILPPLVVTIAIAMRFSTARRFEATPLDLLLIFGAIALPNLPGLEGTPRHLGISVGKFVVLSYAVEMISTLGSRLRTVLVLMCALFFLAITVRAFVS